MQVHIYRSPHWRSKFSLFPRLASFSVIQRMWNDKKAGNGPGNDAVTKSSTWFKGYYYNLFLEA